MKIINSLINKFFKKESDKNKVYCVYSKKIEGLNYRWGTMFFQDLYCNFISGKYGNGPAPTGEYKAYKFILDTRKSFVMFDVGFQVPIEPQFKTDRTFLAIHPDGGPLGSLGCIALHPKDKEHAKRISSAFSNWFICHNRLEIEIL